MITPSYLTNAEPAFIESLYQQYCDNPENLDRTWRLFFDGLAIGQDWFATGELASEANATGSTTGSVARELSVASLIMAYRQRGHWAAQVDPLAPYTGGLQLEPKPAARLDLKEFGLKNEDLNIPTSAAVLLGMPATATLQQVVDRLQACYTQGVGVEFAYITDPEIQRWCFERWDQLALTPRSQGQQVRMMHGLIKASGFESFLNTKFVGQKRFSLEGGDALVPVLEETLIAASDTGVKEVILGMAHRGRLSVLGNVFQKPYDQILAEFEGRVEMAKGDGDVKYHLGFVGERHLDNGKTVQMMMAYNPSHLEAVNPVVMGMAKGRVFHNYNSDAQAVLSILIHGDAAVIGQGVNSESLNLSGIKGYKSGGVLHVVVNNQIGFTANPLDSRFTPYCTDIAKMLECPIIHVNGDKLDDVARVVQFAADFRQKFGRDVVIDLVCFRRYGHNEGDEPRFTQPVMYRAVDQHPGTKSVYRSYLQQIGVDTSFVEEAEKSFNTQLTRALDSMRSEEKPRQQQGMQTAEWAGIAPATVEPVDLSANTGVDVSVLKGIIDKVSDPGSNPPVKKLAKIIESRKDTLVKDQIDWGVGEALALGSLLLEGHPVRLTGQDAKRGTFAHRHGVIFHEESNGEYVPLNHLESGQAQLQLLSSALSEYAATGFEYGYSLVAPQVLVIWEAQFGDFVNGAQITIDQFIAAAESKWGIRSGLTMFLPHGYEGQGPEHSSSRFERFVQLGAEHNIQVVYPTLPAQLFHVLRRQMKRNIRKPLVVITPKSMLRHPLVVSKLEDFAKGRFQEILPDTQVSGKNVTQIVLCTGKIYYDLLAEREKRQRQDVALVRVEQLYPLSAKDLAGLCQDRYPSAWKAGNVFWAQEEPKNMGAWTYMLDAMIDHVRLKCVARKPSASPATGFSKKHAKEQQELVNSVFEGSSHGRG